MSIILLRKDSVCVFQHFWVKQLDKQLQQNSNQTHVREKEQLFDR